MTTQKSLETSKIAKLNKKSTIPQQKQTEIIPNSDFNFRLQEREPLTETQLRMVNETAQAMILTGFSINKTAKKLRLSTRAIHRRMTLYPEIKEQINLYNEMTIDLARKNIIGASYDASEKLATLMKESKNERLQLDSATQILDRSGIVKPSTNIQVNVLNDLRKDKETYDL